MQKQNASICPNCLGNKKVMGFAAPDRVRQDPGGWKAVPCPVCRGTGQVTAEEAERLASLEAAEQGTPVALLDAEEGTGPEP